MRVSKIGIMICGSLILLILILVGGFMIRSIPDAYKSEALILVEQAKPAGAELASTSDEQLSLLVKKSERRMYLLKGRKLSKSYIIALGFNPKGTKLKQGDGATPEGYYFITHKNEKSKFYLSLGVSFPNVSDAATGLKNKFLTQAEHDAIVKAHMTGQKPPQNTKLGGDIFLHGGGTSSDWTWGCIALSNEDIKELFDLLPLKTSIRIEP